MAITTELDLLELIAAGTQESLRLEYKRCAALQNTEVSKNELSKDVSALANAAGGELIYGVIENANLPTGVDAGFDPAGPIKREWLDQVIGSRIQPRIQGIVIRPLVLTGANAGRLAFVIDIPQSHTAHQAADKRYYKRRNFTIDAMEDYEIRDVLNRGKTPLLALGLRAPRFAGDGNQADYRLVVLLRNDAEVSARTIRLELCVPTALFLDHGMGQSSFVDGRNRRDGRDYDERCYVYQRDTIIYPQQEISVANWGVTPPAFRVTAQTYIQCRDRRAEMRWTIYADDMRRQEGQMPAFPDLLDY
jgi:hypothetical protein